MSHSIRTEAVSNAQAVSASVMARHQLLRSKVEVRAVKANMRAYDARTPKRIKQNYVLIGVGGLLMGAAAMTGIFYKSGMLVVPQVSVTLASQATSSQTNTVANSPPAPSQTTTPAATTPVSLPPVPSVKAVNVEAIAGAKGSVFQSVPAFASTEKVLKTSTTKPIAVVPSVASPKQAEISHAKDSAGSDELGFKPAVNYTIVSIPADGVLMIQKNGETAQQLVRVGSKLPDGEELRAVKFGTKEIETNARKFTFRE